MMHFQYLFDLLLYFCRNVITLLVDPEIPFKFTVGVHSFPSSYTLLDVAVNILSILPPYDKA